MAVMGAAGIRDPWAPSGLGASRVPTPFHFPAELSSLPLPSQPLWAPGQGREGPVLTMRQVPGAQELESGLLPGGPGVPGKAPGLHPPGNVLGEDH